ncbi:MAG: TIGR03435 family protein [Janthinobacterium lividum]
MKVHSTAHVSFAWDLNANDSNMIVNAPKWLDDDKFDMVAKATMPESVPGKRTAQLSLDDEEFRQMLRALLIERFKMRVRMEDRPIDAYKLVADHPKMNLADTKSRTRCIEGPGPGGKDPRQANPAMNMLISCRNMTPKQMGEEFAHFAAGYVYSPVRDSTELKGSYDFTLNWSSANQTILKPPPSQSASQQQTSDPDGTMTFYEAVDKQLGLKLVKEKRPVPVLVIESIQETPTDNQGLASLGLPTLDNL